MFYNAPYRWGGRTPNGVDGAGLVQMAYRLAGITIPRYIEQQAGEGQVLSFLEEAQPGDLAFFGDSSRCCYSCRYLVGTGPNYPCLGKSPGG